MFSPNEENPALKTLYISLSSIQNAIWLERKQGSVTIVVITGLRRQGARVETGHCPSLL